MKDRKSLVVRDVLLCLAALALVALGGCAAAGGGAGGAKEYSIVGDWVQMKTSAPHRDVATFSADGTFAAYSDYAKTAFDEGNNFSSWTLSGSTLTLSDGESQMVATLTWVNENSAKLTTESGDIYVYRKGFEPEGNILTHTPVSLSLDTVVPGSVGSEESVLYKFQAPPGPFYIRCDDRHTNETLTGEVKVTLYDAEGGIVLEEFRSTDEQSEKYLPEGSNGFIVIDCGSSAVPGTFKIEVQRSM